MHSTMTINVAVETNYLKLEVQQKTKDPFFEILDTLKKQNGSLSNKKIYISLLNAKSSTIPENRMPVFYQTLSELCDKEVVLVYQDSVISTAAEKSKDYFVPGLCLHMNKRSGQSALSTWV